MRLAVFLVATCVCAAPSPLERSNENARYVLDALAEFRPEQASANGMEAYDARVSDFSRAGQQRYLARIRDVLAELQRRKKTEKDPVVRQDVDILAEAMRETERGILIGQKYFLPYVPVVQYAFQSTRGLLDDQVAPARRSAALVRLKKHTGLDPDRRPTIEVIIERLRADLRNPKLLGPFRDRLENDLKQSGFLLKGIRDLFAKYQIAGYEEPLERLEQQVASYEEFLRKEIMPRARTDFRLPDEVYRNALRGYGIDIPPAQLAALARRGFTALQQQAGEIARQIATQRGWQDSGYRAVIRGLKKEQLVGETILPHYQDRLKQIEEIIRREKLVTLPERPARIRIASAAETAAQPAPHMRPPRLIGNAGESGEFVLPLNIPDSSGKSLQYDDFSFAAASWTLTAHELRPGHELQFSSLVEKGVSMPRAIFAFNSTNVEGWGLYSEAILFPHMPLEGQLISLQHRMLRAARAFLDPELHMGKVTPEEARRVLLEDVVVSEAMTKQEVDRYTFRSPGQAPSYFYGYTRLMELRRDVEARMGSRFIPREFHDFVLAQGLLPPDLLRKAVLDSFAQ